MVTFSSTDVSNEKFDFSGVESLRAIRLSPYAEMVKVHDGTVRFLAILTMLLGLSIMAFLWVKGMSAGQVAPVMVLLIVTMVFTLLFYRMRMNALDRARRDLEPDLNRVIAGVKRGEIGLANCEDAPLLWHIVGKKQLVAYSRGQAE